AKGEKARILIKLADAGTAEVKIYDLNGAKVWETSQEVINDLNIITWDGRSSEGRRVASGIYLVQVDAPGLTKIRKLAIVK
ncbi:MAG: T9SS type A sorting domain-containing protein, partial [Nitrospirota bacterium]|nr:T9SS type A sorting domain-containing protein [Nitrospirota bacterium]